jgi:hypothetical protein
MSYSDKLYVIFYTNETEPTEMAEGLLEIRWFDCPRFKHATAKDVALASPDIEDVR